MHIDITGIDKALLLVALVNKHPMHLGQKNITAEQAQRLGEAFGWDFDYVDRIPLKINITGNAFDPFLYDRDAYGGLAAQICGCLLRENK